MDVAFLLSLSITMRGASNLHPASRLNLHARTLTTAKHSQPGVLAHVGLFLISELLWYIVCLFVRSGLSSVRNYYEREHDKTNKIICMTGLIDILISEFYKLHDQIN